MNDFLMTNAEVLDAVRAEFCVGGQPLKRYGELEVARRMPMLGAVLTLEIVQNLERRIVQLEHAAGLPRGMPID